MSPGIRLPPEERFLRGRLVTLRPLRPVDAVALDRILRDRQVTRTLPPRVRRESGPQFVRRVLREQRSGGGYAFAIRPVGSAETIGQIRLIDWSRSDRRAEVGYWLRRKYWGHGYATESLRLVCRFGFLAMGLHRLVAWVDVGNVRSSRVLEKAGFRREGRARSDLSVREGWSDVWYYGLLRREWREEVGTPG